MKKQRMYQNVCFWLCVIAILLFVGVVLFGVFLHQKSFITLIDFKSLFCNSEGAFDSAIFWSAISAIAAIIAAIIAYIIGKKTIEISNKVANIEHEQSRLYTEPHTIVNAISVQSVVWSTSADGKKIKTIKDCNFPYYTELTSTSDLNDLVMLKIDFINTSEAFARLRFNEAEFKEQEKIIAKFNMSTMGTHANHIIVPINSSQSVSSIGLILHKESIKSLRGTALKLSCYLDNNFNSCYLETQNYLVADITDDFVSYYPINYNENRYEKIH